jgi:hypothetical protein
MIKKLRDIWNNQGFEILFGLSIIVILIISLFRIGKKGTWDKSFIYKPSSIENSYIPQQSPIINNKKDSSGEIECRRVMQKIFGKSFDKCRPNFLNNPVTGGVFNLELDMFNKDMGLACEYNGAQHYKYIPYFHKNKEAFINQKYRDELKRRMCKDNHVILIEVPYTIKISDIENHIIVSLKKNGYNI